MVSVRAMVVSKLKPLVGTMLNRRMTMVGCVTLICGLWCSGCSSPESSCYDRDPGNVRLHALESDPVFAKLPPESTLVPQLAPYGAKNLNRAVVANPAHVVEGLGGPSCIGLSVTETFSSKLKENQVFAFINILAISAGWTYIGAYEWQKRASDESVVDLSLSLVIQPYVLQAGEL